MRLRSYIKIAIAIICISEILSSKILNFPKIFSFCLVQLVYFSCYLFYFYAFISIGITMRRVHVLKEFGNNIRMTRTMKKISQMKLAELAGCSLQAIGNIERGQANPSLVMVYKIADALDVNTKDLIP